MNKRGVMWEKIVGIIIAVVVLIFLLLFAGKLNWFKGIFAKLFAGAGFGG